MVRSAQALARQKERTDLRRDQVLDAAELCFRAEGFHRASMSRIAAVAKMSVGHIYQYFENKEAIIIALCERSFSGFETLIPGAETGDGAEIVLLVEAWIAQFAWWIDPVRAPLTLEIMAEAGRNSKVADVVATIDRRFRDMMRRSLLPLFGDLPQHRVEQRLEAVVMLAHGLTSRVTADPDADPAKLIGAFGEALHAILGTGTSTA